MLISRITAQPVSVPQQIISSRKSGTRRRWVSSLHDDVTNPLVSHLKEFQYFLKPKYGHTSCRIIGRLWNTFFFSRSISLFLLEAFGTKKLMWGDTEWCADILCRIHVTTTNLWTLPTSVTFLLISLILSFFKYLIWKTLRQHVYVREYAAGEHF